MDRDELLLRAREVGRVRKWQPLSALALVLVILCPLSSYASEETDALRQQIKLLEARLAELERREQVREQLQEKPVAVERKQEAPEGYAKAKTEKTPAIEIGAGKGLTITSPDQQYALRLRAYAQADSRTFFDNSNTTNVNTFLIRSARPVLESKMTDYFAARMMLDFGNGSSRLLDAYVDFKPWKEFNVRLGKMKVPLGLERWQSEQETLFVERGMTTNLVPFRDTGVMFFGELIPTQLEYQIAITNGAVDLGDNNSNADDNQDINARIFLHPFRRTGMPLLSGLGLGVAGSAGDHHGTAPASNLTAGYTTFGQSRFFTFLANSFADGTRWRLNPQAYYYHGPLSLLGEYVLNTQKIRHGANTGTLQNKAWMAIATYVLTGEDASFDGVKPSRSFDFRNHQWGAFEIVGRAGALTVDKRAFPSFADMASSAQGAHEAAVGGTWYFNPSLKFSMDYAWTRFDGGAAGDTDREDEKTLLTRAQFRF